MILMNLHMIARRFDSKLFADAVVNAVSHWRQLIGPLYSAVHQLLSKEQSTVVINYVESMPSFAKVILCLLDAHVKCRLILKNLKSGKKSCNWIVRCEDNENAECFKCVLTDDKIELQCEWIATYCIETCSV